MVQLELSNTWLLSGNLANARTAADGFLQSTLSTSDPYLQALAWGLQARVAMAESDLPGARESIQRALAIVDSSEIQGGAWQTFATASEVYRYSKQLKTAETYRDRAESCILQIVDSFEPDEPLRATFLTADPVRRILQGKVATKATRQRELRHGAVPGA